MPSIKKFSTFFKKEKKIRHEIFSFFRQNFYNFEIFCQEKQKKKQEPQKKILINFFYFRKILKFSKISEHLKTKVFLFSKIQKS